MDKLVDLSSLGQTKDKEICKYTITRGERKGQICGAKIISNDAFCSKHRKHKKPKKSTTKPQEPSKPDVLETIEETLVIKKDQQGRYCEPRSGFLFKDEYTVYGKLDSDGKVVALNSKDVIIAELHDWKYTPA